MVGKPYSGKPNVRIDEGELEIERSATTPALYSTDTDGWNYLRQFVVVEGKYYLLYIGRFDFIFLDLGLLFF